MKRYVISSLALAVAMAAGCTNTTKTALDPDVEMIWPAPNVTYAPPTTIVAASQPAPTTVVTAPTTTVVQAQGTTSVAPAQGTTIVQPSGSTVVPAPGTTTVVPRGLDDGGTGPGGGRDDAGAAWSPAAGAGRRDQE